MNTGAALAIFLKPLLAPIFAAGLAGAFAGGIWAARRLPDGWLKRLLLRDLF